MQEKIEEIENWSDLMYLKTSHMLKLNDWTKEKDENIIINSVKVPLTISKISIPENRMKAYYFQFISNRFSSDKIIDFIWNIYTNSETIKMFDEKTCYLESFNLKNHGNGTYSKIVYQKTILPKPFSNRDILFRMVKKNNELYMKSIKNTDHIPVECDGYTRANIHHFSLLISNIKNTNNGNEDGNEKTIFQMIVHADPMGSSIIPYLIDFYIDKTVGYISKIAKQLSDD